MVIMRKREWLLLLTSIVQIIILYIADHFFTKELDQTARGVELSLSHNGMAAEQVNTIALSISSIGSNVSWFVLGTGITLILTNLGVLISIVNSKNHE